MCIEAGDVGLPPSFTASPSSANQSVQAFITCACASSVSGIEPPRNVEQVVRHRSSSFPRALDGGAVRASTLAPSDEPGATSVRLWARQGTQAPRAATCVAGGAAWSGRPATPPSRSSRGPRALEERLDRQVPFRVLRTRKTIPPRSGRRPRRRPPTQPLLVGGAPCLRSNTCSGSLPCVGSSNDRGVSYVRPGH